VAVAGQLLLKRVMMALGPIPALTPSELVIVLRALLRQPLLYVAGLVYVFGFALWLVVLSRLELSIAYPVLALTYILVPLASHLFFGEAIPPLRWLGMLVIMIGVVIVGISTGG
ncbi:MAG TPA: multidrug resistance protein, partial [Chloroflexi bacterium]|nr:multidrug resistance protein [Chloroflexota bacterium]